MVEDTRENYEVGDTIFAQLISKLPNGSVWLSVRGTPIWTYNYDDFEPYDFAELEITMYETAKNYGKIVANIVDRVTIDDIYDELDDYFDRETIRRDAIRAFIDSTPIPDVVSSQSNAQTAEVDYQLLPILTRLYYTYQRNIPSPTERLKYLGNSIALSTFTSDLQSQKFLQFAVSYLQAIVSFASSDNIHDIKLPDIDDFADNETVQSRFKILELLKEYGKSELSAELKELANQEDQLLLSKLARLIFAANSIRETLSAATLNTLKREIVKNLSIETEGDVEIDSETIPYIGTESNTIEFKSSIVFPPNNNMQPNYTLQSHNIFKAICGFLNSKFGGTLYIGVNDLGYVTGLSEDFRQLNCNTFDEFSRKYIQDPLIAKLGKNIMTYINIESGYDERVAIIKVESFPFGIIELEGNAYVRADRETRLMTDQMKAQITAEKINRDKEKVNNLLNLQKAQYNQRVAILHKYASSNSGTLCDRRVEVYEILHDDGLIVAFDCDSKSCKIFNISRIDYVELTDIPWENQDNHEKKEIDAFHMSGVPQYDVSLQLDLLAKNLLVEQYPRTKDDLSNDRNDPNIWYYSAKLAGLDAITRFYVGLADHITINDSPELKKNISEYISDNFS